jgi:hypothetical protein
MKCIVIFCHNVTAKMVSISFFLLEAELLSPEVALLLPELDSV